MHGEIKNLYRKFNLRFRDKFNLDPPSNRSRRRTTAMTTVRVSTNPLQERPPTISDFPRSNNKNIEDWLTNSLGDSATSVSQDNKY